MFKTRPLPHPDPPLSSAGGTSRIFIQGTKDLMKKIRLKAKKFRFRFEPIKNIWTIKRKFCKRTEMESEKRNWNSTVDNLIKIAFVRMERAIKYPLTRRFCGAKGKPGPKAFLLCWRSSFRYPNKKAEQISRAFSRKPIIDPRSPCRWAWRRMTFQ